MLFHAGLQSFSPTSDYQGSSRFNIVSEVRLYFGKAIVFPAVVASSVFDSRVLLTPTRKHQQNFCGVKVNKCS